MLELKNITKVYKTNLLMQKALDNVSIKFRKNEFVSVLGPSGSGKTTLLNIIGGLDHYTTGDLIINNKSTKNFSDKDWDSYRNCCVGFIFQNYNLISHISVYKNVEMALTLSNCKSFKRKALVLNALDKVGLKNHAYKKPNQLSGGQMQRVAIARALVNDPDIILADEPTGALDSKTSTQIMELIKEISKDKLVIMVTHNDELAKEYSNRIIKLKDGSVIDDNNSLKDNKSKDIFKIKRTKMSFLSAIMLSLNNIKTKKGRTFLTAFASSIGIIGIALILSISNGFNKQIEDYEKNTMSSFPIAISNVVSTMNEEGIKDNKDSFSGTYEYPKKNVLYSYSEDENSKVHNNIITEDYVNYIKNIDEGMLSAISYYRITNFNLIAKNENNYRFVNTGSINLSGLPEDLGDKSYLKENYDLLSGTYPNSSNEVVLIVDKKNRIDKSLLEALFIDKDSKEVSFDDVVGKEFKIVNNDDYYKNVENNIYIRNEANEYMYNKNNIAIKISGIVRGKKDNKLAAIMDAMSESMGASNVSKIGYSNKLIEEIINQNKNSKIVKSQELSDGVVFMGNASFSDVNITKDEALVMLGAKDVPVMMNIYPNNFSNKDKIIKYLDDYNKNKKDVDKIIYTDYAKQISSLSSGIMDAITIVLVAFSSISLIVSSIMIGIITYISVLERTKEIGILRSLGARKKDITRVFNAETLIIGLISGFIGIVVTLILLVPVNHVLYKLTELKNIGILNPYHAIILVLISVILTLIGGFIPAKAASKKDPVIALRSE